VLSEFCYYNQVFKGVDVTNLMAKDWQNDIKDAIAENKKTSKKTFPFRAIGFILLIVSTIFLIFVDSENVEGNFFLLLLPPLLMCSMIIFFIVPSYIERKNKVIITWLETGIYYLNELTIKIEKYQNRDTPQMKKTKLKKEIFKLLDKLETISYKYKRAGDTYIYTEQERRASEFFRKHVYKLNHEIKKNNQIDIGLLGKIREFCQGRMDLVDKHEKEKIVMMGKQLDEIEKVIKNEDSEIGEKKRIKRIKSVPFWVKFVIFAVISLVTIFLIMNYIVPIYYDLTGSDIITTTIIAWAALFAGCSILVAYKDR